MRDLFGKVVWVVVLAPGVAWAGDGSGGGAAAGSGSGSGAAPDRAPPSLLAPPPGPPEEASPPPAPPPSLKPDTTYGRIDGDLSVVAGIGLTVGPHSPRAAADLRLRYLDTAGLFFDYEDGVLLGGSPEPQRVLAGGLELRPLFLARWLTGREQGTPRLDLALDSIGLEIGGFFAQPIGTSLTQRPGFQAGLGIELPIAAAANGPWIGLHGGVRWSDRVLGGQDIQDAADRAAFFTITIAWHQFFGGHVVDLGDRAPR